MKSNEIKVQPVISEKSYEMANALNKYTFSVPRGVNKIEVAKWVEKTYKVKVVSINSVISPGKLKRDWKTNIKTRKSDKVKIIVTLKEGNKIDEFLKG
ncbi:MAG: 50S ribosomal protein L23 [Candidatus Dojkabacteria bacterium]|jgi:large subunit ribosomal protein L23|nr:50S ribosomal protein L23 [Candidatus Dojkabacteria bacterium]MDD4561263.1 50S ribosomal protein L23 [Candidatus Dojkabacteria bacterium]NLB12262.1 50S ribosomal protein L23 [Candidatus Dojkabacteria bacterium]